MRLGETTEMYRELFWFVKRASASLQWLLEVMSSEYVQLRYKMYVYGV